MEATIEVSGLRKRYGHTVAVDGLSFTVHPGQVTGFVGPNGAGKSTTLRVIIGLDRPDAGSALVGGQPYQKLAEPLRTVGAMLDASAIHPARGARNHLLWLAHAGGLPARRVDEVLEQVGLAAVAKRPAGGFSLGMRQRLGIAAAAGDRIELRTARRLDAMTLLANAGATVAATGDDAVTVSGMAAERIIELLTGGGVPFSGIGEHRASLEEAYMELTRDAVQFGAEAESTSGEVR
jgi:ABC-type transport system involved in cytochrome c biogenesis ATPase subunit